MKKPTQNALARYLASNDLSPAAFGQLVGADRQQIWRLANGARGPSVDLAVRIEEATDGAVPVESWAKAKRPTRRAA